MNTRQRRVVAAIAAVAIAFSMVGCAKTSGQPEKARGGEEPIKVGAILSLTGTYAAMGEAEKDALELEVKRINDSGGVDGRSLEQIIEDDATDEAKAVAAATKLIDQEGVVAILGATGTGGSMAIRNDIGRAGVPQISMAGGTVITAQFDPLVFQTPWSNTIVVPFVLERIKSDGYKKVALVSDSGGYGKDGRGVILEAAKKAGIEIVADETFNAGDTDMTAQLQKVKGSGADAFLLWTAGKEAATVVKGVRDLGIELPMYGGSGQARSEFIAGAGEAAEGFVIGTGRSFVASSWEGDSSEVLGSITPFLEAYEAEFGEAPDIFAGHAYDALTILVAALEKAGADADGEALREAMESGEVLGYGGKFNYSATDHNGLGANDLAAFVVKSGEWTVAE